jgi:hypothetical protein
MILLCVACGPVEPSPVLDLPPRASDAPSGYEVARAIQRLSIAEREEHIYREISRGNVPSWLRELGRVELTGEVDGRTRRVTFWATPDYLAVGSDSDFVTVPVSPGTALRIAELVGGSLPTPRMVDAVRARLAPIRIPPDEYITTVAYFVRHDRLVHAQRRLHRVPPGVFVAGHKVDVVLATGTLATGTLAPGASAGIYGWHRMDGTPIQPLYADIRETWVSYNLGVRLLDRGLLVDGVRRDLQDALRDPGISPLLTATADARHAEAPEQ